MMIPSKELLIGYDYDAWYGYSEKLPVTVDASTKNNTETLICGMSGSGKSFLVSRGSIIDGIRFLLLCYGLGCVLEK